MDDLRALTIRQPYASLIAHRTKRFETRTWKTSYRGPLLIHAAVRWEPGWRNIWVDPDRDGPELERYDILIEQLGLEPTEDVNGSGYWTAWDGGRLPLGAVVAVAELVDCIPIQAWRDEPRGDQWGHARLCPAGESNPRRVFLREDGCLAHPILDDEHDITDQIPYGHWEPGGWAWQLEDIRPLAEPVPAKGRQGLWRPDPDLAAAVTEGNQP